MSWLEMLSRILAALTLAACGIWMVEREEWTAFSVLVLAIGLMGVELQLRKITDRWKP